MPKLNSVGSAAQGTSVTSIDGSTPTGLGSSVNGAPRWFSDDILILQNDFSGTFKLGRYVVSTTTLTVEDANGENELGAGGGVWAAYLSVSGVRTSVSGLGPFASAGLADVSPDGQTVLVVSQSQGRNLAVYDDAGDRELSLAVELSSSVVRLRDDYLAYQFGGSWALRRVSTQALADFTSQTATVNQLVPVVMGAKVYVVEVTESLTIRPKDGQVGYLLGATGACFAMDAIRLNSTTVRIAYSTGIGEAPDELVVIDINPVSGAWIKGVVVTGALVFTSQGVAPKVNLPGTSMGGETSPFSAVLRHPIAEPKTGILTDPWRKAFQNTANQQQAASQSISDIEGQIGDTDIATELASKASEDEPFVVTAASPDLPNSSTVAEIHQRGTTAAQPVATAVPVGTYYTLTDSTPANKLQRSNGTTWQDAAPGSGSGDVVGPGSATDNAIARFDTTTGKLIQNSGITIADGASGALSGTNTGDQNVQDLLDGISTTQGTVLYRNASDWVALSPGTSGQFLETLGAAANPTWATLPSGSGNQISSTAIGSEPGSPATGDYDLYTDAPYMARYSGALWAPFGPVFKFTTPTGSFSWVNQGSATISTANGGMLLTGAATGSGVNFQVRVESASAPFTRIAYVLPCMVQKANQSVGMCFRQSSDGKMACLHFAALDTGSTTIAVASQKMNTATSASTSYRTLAVNKIPNWWKLEDNNTDRKIYFSENGLSWIEFHSVGRTDFLTADQVGFYVNTDNSATPNFAPILHVLSWV